MFTFKIIRQPSEQLLSIYGINQKDDCMKQVPLLFVRIYFSATWIAVKEVFSDARVQGCSFTGDRRWWGSVADLGLKTAYEEWQEVDRLTRKLLALPYLPPGQIRGAFVNLRQFANTPPLRQLLQYVEETWINSDVRGICEGSVFRLAVRTDNDVGGTYIQYDQFLCNFINV